MIDEKQIEKALRRRRIILRLNSGLEVLAGLVCKRDPDRSDYLGKRGPDGNYEASIQGGIFAGRGRSRRLVGLRVRLGVAPRREKKTEAARRDYRVKLRAGDREGAGVVFRRQIFPVSVFLEKRAVPLS